MRTGRKDEILAVFTEKVARQGYDVTSVSQIATELGLSKGTIMHHFPSKDRMLKDMSLGYMQRRLARLAVIKDTCPTPATKLDAILTDLITSSRDDRDATLAFSREFMRFVEEPVMAEVRALRRQYTGEVQAVVEQGMADKSFRESNATVVTLQLIGMCNWTWTWLEPGGALSVDEVAKVFVSTALCGVLVDADTYGPCAEPALDAPALEK